VLATELGKEWECGKEWALGSIRELAWGQRLEEKLWMEAMSAEA